MLMVLVGALWVGGYLFLFFGLSLSLLLSFLYYDVYDGSMRWSCFALLVFSCGSIHSDPFFSVDNISLFFWFEDGEKMAIHYYLLFIFICLSLESEEGASLAGILGMPEGS